MTNEATNAAETIGTTNQIHKFEAAGLGKAPFKYIGMVAQDISYGERVLSRKGGVTITTKPGGSCAYCGTYIVDMFNVKSADGKVFHVGCDCILKVGDAGLTKQIKSDVAKMARDKRHAREQRKISEATAKLATVREVLVTLPHPREYWAKQGKTLADYVDWMFANGGTAASLAAARIVEAHSK